MQISTRRGFCGPQGIVCKPCNSYFGSKVEPVLLADPAWGRSMLAKRGGYGVQRLYRIEGRTSPAHPAQKAADFREMSTRLIQFILQL
jgi:hypothetical protein